MSLLENYNQMRAQAELEAEKIAEKATEETEKVATAEQMEVIMKYAEAADYYLAQEFGEDYVANDVVELATMMINHDQIEKKEAEKTASLEEAGRVIARGFLAEINKEVK